MLVRPESDKTELINSAGEEKGIIRGKNGDEEYEMSPDSGGTSSSKDGQKKNDLGLEEANGDERGSQRFTA